MILLLGRFLRLYAESPRWLRILLAILWASTIWWSSSGPVSSGESQFWQIVLFNGAHVVVYGVLAALIYLALLGLSSRALIWAFLLSTAYGCIDEFHQMAVPERHPSALDVLSDALGSALSLTALCCLQAPSKRTVSLLAMLALLSVLVVFLASLG